MQVNQDISVATAASLGAALWRMFRRDPIRGLSHFLHRSNFDESIVAAVAGHRGTLEIMRRPQLRVLIQEHPEVVYRPFRGYLATNFGKKERREALQEHYRYLTDALGESFFLQIVQGNHTLWRRHIDQDGFSVTLSFPPSAEHDEGDLLLDFQSSGVPLYRLSFSVAPGHLVGSADAQVALIARVQGVQGQFAAIRHATKACSDIAPPHILMAAVQGIAAALDIKCMAGVRNSQRICAGLQSGPGHYFDYDAFWKTISASEGQNFFLMPVPVVERPLEQIDVVHRRRTRLKRQFKCDIREAIRSNFIDAFLLAAASAPASRVGRSGTLRATQAMSSASSLSSVKSSER
jgi:uncharacterized protein VirK/YbjX